MRVTKIRFSVQKPALCTLTYSATRTWPLRPSTLAPDYLLTASKDIQPKILFFLPPPALDAIPRQKILLFLPPESDSDFRPTVGESV
jgi:hypothetical protein